MSKTILLYAAEMRAATLEIKALGGRVAQQLSQHILVADLPDAFDVAQLKSSSADMPANLDDISRRAVTAVRGIDPSKKSEHEGLPWGTPGFQPPHKLDPREHIEALKRRGVTRVANDQMTGTIAIGLVTVASTGGLEFSDAETNKVSQEVYLAAQFLQNSEPAADITFIRDEMNLSIVGDVQVEKTKMTDSPSAVVFGNDLFCFHQGQKGDNALWYNVFDGETKKWKGDTKVENVKMTGSPSAVSFGKQLWCFHQGNNNDGTLWYSVYDSTTKTWAADRQIANVSITGSPSAVVYKGDIYCFYQGAGNKKGQLWYKVFDGQKKTWNDVQLQVPGTAMSESPSAVNFNDTIVCFHQGPGNDGSLLAVQFNGQEWLKEILLVTGAAIVGSPAAVVKENSIYCFHQRDSKKGQLWFDILIPHKVKEKDTFASVGDSEVAGVGMSASPSAAYFKGQLWCLHQGLKNNQELWYRVFDDIDPANVYESIWRNPVLKQLGYSQNYEGCIQFADALCEKYGTNHAYIAFFTKFPTAWHAYAILGGVEVVIQYPGGPWSPVYPSWGPDSIRNVFAHESCHIFGALDEYRTEGGPGGQKDCNCSDTGGIYKVKNGNCISCPGAKSNHVECLMDLNTLALCTYTQGQIGWLPQSGLFVLHSDASKSDNKPGYSVLAKGQWWRDKLVPNTGISQSPAAVMYRGKLYCFHQGNKDNGTLWYNVFDGANWSGDLAVANTRMSGSPSAVLFESKIYCFHQGNKNDGTLWYNIFDGETWLGDKQVKQTGMSESPSAVVFNDQIYCFHQGQKNDGNLWLNIFNGNEWLGDSRVPDTRLSGSPSAVLFDDELFCLYRGSENHLWYNVYNGEAWAGIKEAYNVSLSESPSAVFYEGKLYCFYRQTGGSQNLRYSIFNRVNGTWSNDMIVAGVTLSASPAAIDVKFPPRLP